MSIDSVPAREEEKTNVAALLDELQRQLREQIKAIHAGNITKVEAMSRQLGPLVDQISRSRVLPKSQFKKQRDNLSKLYRDLCLAVSAQRQSTSQELARVRKGRKTVNTYGNNF